MLLRPCFLSCGLSQSYAIMLVSISYVSFVLIRIEGQVKRGVFSRNFREFSRKNPAQQLPP